MTQKQFDKAEELFSAAFGSAREPRSDAYKRGVLAVLVFRCGGAKPSQARPYKVGTAEADAFHAGCDEGNAIWRAHKKTLAQPPSTKAVVNAENLI